MKNCTIVAVMLLLLEYRSMGAHLSQAGISEPTDGLNNQTELFVDHQQVNAQSKKKITLDYQRPEEFLADFLNTSCHRDKPVKYWAAQLILFFQQDPALKTFCRELARATASKDPMRIGCVFLRHQHTFAASIKNPVMRDLKKIWSALEARCACDCPRK